MKTVLIFLVVGLLAAFTHADEGAAPKDQPAKFKIMTKRKDDSVEVRADKEKTVFIVKNPFGISQAVIQREGEKWPKAVVLRLHLKGLESFRASNGKFKIGSALANQYNFGHGRIGLTTKGPAIRKGFSCHYLLTLVRQQFTLRLRNP